MLNLGSLLRGSEVEICLCCNPSLHIAIPCSVQLQRGLMCRQGLYDFCCAPNTTVLLISISCKFPLRVCEDYIVQGSRFLANVQADSSLSRLNVLRERIDATEALISIHLDSRRNDLVAFDLVSRVRIAMSPVSGFHLHGWDIGSHHYIWNTGASAIKTSASPGYNMEIHGLHLHWACCLWLQVETINCRNCKKVSS